MKSVEKKPSKRKTTQPRDSSTGKFVKSPDRKQNQKRRSAQKNAQKGGRKSRSPSPTSKKNTQTGQLYHKK